MAAATPAMAQGMVGAPQAWGMGLQEAGGPIKEAIHDFNDLVLVIIIVITVFVAGAAGLVMWRFRASVNPTPSTHQPQHDPGGGLDGGPGGDPADHRHPVLPADLLRGPDARTPT